MNRFKIQDIDLTAELEVEYATYGKHLPATATDPPESPEIDIMHVRAKVLGIEVVLAFDYLPDDIQDRIMEAAATHHAGGSP